MKQNAIALEISHKYLKVVFGYVLGKQVVINYAKKIPLEHVMENGVIKDRASIIKELSKNNPLVDQEYHLSELIDKAILILPPYGLEVYQTKQITSVISPERIVGELDVKNIYSIIRNKKLPVDNELIDIIPDAFVLDNGDKYALPPIGKESSAITAYAKVHTLPSRINAEYSECLKESNIKVSRRVVAPFAVSELLSTYEEIPDTYFLVDIGASTTSISLVGKNQLFATRSFSWGGDNITDHIVRSFNISEAEAERIKILFGLDKRTMKFDYSVCKAQVGESVESYSVAALNEIIESELVEFVKRYKMTVEQLSNLYNIENPSSMPVILLGGGAKLKGLVPCLKEKLSLDNIQILKIKSIGARDSSYANLVGAILVDKKYPVAKDQVSSAPISVTREE